jgi:hypothetical protein
MRGVLLLTMLTVAVVPAAAGSFSDGTAQANEAKKRAAARDYLGAAGLYREAYRRSPESEYLCNVGVAYYRANDFPRASLYLERCLAASGDLPESFVKRVLAALSTVRRELERGPYMQVRLLTKQDFVRVTVEGFDEHDAIDAPATVWVLRGDRKVVARAPGYREATLMARQARGTVEVRIELEPIVARRATPPVALWTPESDAKPRRRVLPWVTSGATVVVAAGAAWSWGQARYHANAAKNELTREGFDAEIRAGKRWQKISWVGGGVAAIGVVGSAILFMRRPEQPSLGVIPERGGAMATFAVSY